jgi:2-octaprenyl-6-methoxyphenol hydroxylase
VLKRYENWRRFETSALAASTDLINKVFSNESRPLRFIVNATLKSINSNKILKKNIMREAAGLHGDLPKLLQGKLI